MSSRHHKDDVLIAEYTLGLLEADELAQAHTLLGQDDTAAACALHWEQRLLHLTDALTPLNPSEQLLHKIQATLGLPRSAMAAPQPSPRASASVPLPASDTNLDPSTAAVFEPRLIRPDSVSFSASQASAPANHTTASQRPAAVAPVAPAQKPVEASTAPARVRAAPPDPMEAFRPAPDSHRSPRPSLWRNFRFWQALSAALAILAVVLALPENTLRQDAATNAALQPAVAPAPQVVQVAVMQAPGTSSTPGWILTVDNRQNVVLAPQVDIIVPESDAVYLWTYNEKTPHPRLLGLVDPTRSLTLPMDVTGEISPGQIFEMTQETGTTMPQEPTGPILFIGRTVSLG